MVEPTTPWTAAARCDYARRGKRSSSDLSDREWALISPFLPEPRPVGRPRTTDLREVDLQDRDGAAHVLKSVRHRYPWLRHVFADGGYAGEKLKGRLRKIGRWTFQIIKRSDRAEGFEVLPRRWVMEQTFAWLGRCRRLAKDFEKSIASAEAWIFVANPRLLTRRFASYCYPS